MIDPGMARKYLPPFVTNVTTVEKRSTQLIQDGLLRITLLRETGCRKRQEEQCGTSRT
jgi:hypothetical protein